MLGLTIKALRISVTTNGGVFSCAIPFAEGLNIIRAENSSGKSTCMNAIAYGLGLEAILGPSRKRPFPKSLYNDIFDNKADQNPYFVSSSTVTLTVANARAEVVRISRDVAGDDSKVVVDNGSQTTDYFLGAAGTVGSAISERGFHHWLADFIGWHLPNVVTFDGKEAILYLECIFPLFFIEQKRGWSEIQANIPTYYGIRNVRRTAAEFCLGIDSFEFEKKVVQHRNAIEGAEAEWQKLMAEAAVAAEFYAVQLSPIPAIENYSAAFSIDFTYLEGDTAITVAEQQRSLTRLIRQLSDEAAATAPDSRALNTQQTLVRNLRRELDEVSSSIEVTMLSVSETEKKITTLRRDLDQYQQLRRLRNVGSSINASLDTQKCPICESDLYDTLGNRTGGKAPMTLDENIEFLKSQIEFFENVQRRSLSELDQYRAKARLVQSRIDTEAEKLKEIREDIDGVNGAASALLRARIRTEAALREVNKLQDIVDDLKERAIKIHSQWAIATEALRVLRRQATVDSRGLVINELESIIRANLASFNFNPAAIGAITVSRQTLRPEQEGYDIVAETSASDYIRIIWAYTLALMELAGQRDDVRHGGFVVFDEPRQHEASKVSFTNLIDKASHSRSYGGQVIFATSMDQAELQNACEGRAVNLTVFDDYILTLEDSSSA